MDKDNKQKSAVAEREEKIISFWKENESFKKSLEKESPKGNYVFYDGPPFATGLPHYGHILGSTCKDVFGRYKTMQGYMVPRKWGWDCHGLPIENIVEKDLGISGKGAIEEFGIKEFVEHARSKVLTYVGEWEKTVERIGRWVDFKNSYKTMDNTFIESVWWALGEMNKKELLYEGVRVLAYCPRCETPIANSEIAMDNSYKDITDISVYVKFKLTNEPNTYLLAWTTTPWTLPGNTAIAINKDIDYVFFSYEGATYISAKEFFIKDKKFPFEKEKAEIIKEVKGSELVGLSYEPVFSYFKDKEVAKNPNIWKVWHADFVNVEQGTGIAHEAPAFGEDDMVLAQKNNIPFIKHVNPDGTFIDEVEDFKGLKVKPKEDHQKTDIEVIKHLAHKGALFAKEKIIHSYPHCWRCETPLLYYALPSWFVNIQKIKKEMLKDAESMNWIPEYLKEGRFKNSMENAPDWTISRNRYWASPLPIWKSHDGKILFVNSLETLRKHTKKSGNKYLVMRHGEADHNLLGMASSDPNEPVHLTEKGKEQVKAKIDELKNQGVEIIVTSPFVRTRETAQLIKESLNISDSNYFIDERLREIDIGVYNKGTWAKFHEDYPKTKENFFIAPEGGESYAQVKGWMMNFINDLEIKYKGKKILIVTHGGPAWLLLAGAHGYDAENTLDMVRHKKDFHYFENAEFMEVPYVTFPHNENWELDMHRPYIDHIILEDENGTSYYRIPEVIDCWYESGSMPFAQDHYPFERPNWKKENFPGGFVAEYIAQTRTWFYYTHVVSSVLFGKAPFENVVTTGTVLAEDGQKMSKSKNNFPDPWIIFNKYGVDALRFYLMSSSVMKGEDFNFSEKGVQDVTNKIVNRLDNVVAFYELYRDKSIEKDDNPSSENVLDTWIVSRLGETLESVTSGMESYDMVSGTRPIESLIEDLSTWYLRRSRERIKEGDKEAKQTMYFVLKNLAKMLAPFTPFIAEDVWQKLKNEKDVESVHLAEWPEVIKFNKDILTSMQLVRDICNVGNMLRKKENVPLRQPLATLYIDKEVNKEYEEIIKDELNVKSLEKGEEISFDMKITEELKQEGMYREFVRAVQDVRKEESKKPDDIVVLNVETDSSGKDLINKWQSQISKIVGAKEIVFVENSGKEVKIDTIVFKISLE
ncbi:MAG: isoleucyl-tRNA synthetase [Patescibacteria group bacterium]|nr:isoleucyl-tRNA synthetase [Patescibacteria group bacterium]